MGRLIPPESPRALDRKATKIARARHQRGLDRLRELFAWDAESAHAIWLAKRQSFGASERLRRRKRGKAQRAARRKSRAA
jgi:hypothetical protein